MSDWKFHCDVLSVPEEASAAEIKAAFRKLALKHHPDRNGGTQASKEKFQRLNISYKYLMRNLVSRPRPSGPAAPPGPEQGEIPNFDPPPKFRPPPPPDDKRWRRIDDVKKRAPLPPALEKVRRFWVRHRETILQALPATASCVAVLISIAGFFLHGGDRIGASDRAPASATGPRDELGRALGRCEYVNTAKNGKVMRQKIDTLSEWACNLRSYEWFHEAEELDGVALWEGREIRHHEIGKNGAPIDDSGGAEITLDAVPSGETILVPTETRNGVVNQAETLTFELTPKVWISDSRLVRGEPGESRRSVKLTPLRAGEAVVWVTDKIGQPVKKIIFLTRQAPAP